MKNYLRYGIISLLVIVCYDNDILSPDMSKPLDLGVESKSTLFKTQRVITTDGHATVLMEVTPGALYSLQLTSLEGKILAVQGFTAERVSTQVELDYSRIKNGSYDLNLLDVSGNIVKIPVIINKQ